MDRTAILLCALFCFFVGLGLMRAFDATVVVGALAGFLVGLLPGIHINTLVALLGVLGANLPALLGAASVAHLFGEMLPSMLLSAPSEQFALSVLPSQRLLREGRGRMALLSALAGTLIGALTFFILSPAAVHVIPLIYQYLHGDMGWVLLTLSAILVLTEARPHIALIIFLLSGLFGAFILSGPQDSGLKLFLMLTGCFGFGSLVANLISPADIPVQRPVRSVHPSVVPCGILGAIGGFVVGVFPAVSCSQTVALLSPLIATEEGFIAAVSSATVTSLLFSTITLYTMGKARNGVMASLGSLNLNSLVQFVAPFALLSLPLSLMVLWIGERLMAAMHRYNRQFNLATAVFLLGLSCVIGGWWGLLVFLASAGIGISTILLGVRRTIAMGMLVVPTILLYLG